jgi:hypothetical protein
MNEILWILYIIIGFVITIPLLQFGLYKINKGYKSFLYVSLILLVWWIIDFLRLISTNPVLIYYLSLLIFPIVYLLVFSVFEASLRYLRKPLNKYLIFGFIAFFFVNLFISITNNLHHLVIDLSLSDSITFDTFKEVTFGPFFTVHIVITYILLLVSVTSIIYKLFIRLKETGVSSNKNSKKQKSIDF